MSAPTAAVLIIGDEILSGRTRESNLAFLGTRLAEIGIAVAEARVVRDRESDIIEALNALRARNTYVFTTGGIGPTHDDITSAAVAKAFGLPLEQRREAVARLQAYYGTTDLSEPRLKMATVPQGATLIDNPVSSAPGFRVENCYVLAGVPEIMQAMFEALKHELDGGAPILSRAVTAPIGESRLAEGLADIQQRYADTSIGSYPYARQGRVAVSIVIRGTDSGRLAAAADEVAALMRAVGVPEQDIAVR